MPIYTVQAPDGKTYDIEGPEGATPEQLGSVISQSSNVPLGQKMNKEINSIARQLGLSARAGIEGVGDTVDFLDSPFRALLNVKPGIGTNAANWLGLPKPETKIEKVANTGARFMVPGAAFVKGGHMLKNGGEVARGVGGLLSANPALQLTSAASGGAAGEYVKETGGNAPAQFIASLAGGLAAPVAVNALARAPQALMNWSKRFVEAVAPGISRPAESPQINIVISQALRDSGITLDQLPASVLSSIRSDVSNAMQQGENLNADALRRLVDYRMVGATPRSANLTMDPVALTQQKNLAKLGANSQDPNAQLLARAENSNNSTLIDSLNGVGGRPVDRFTAGEGVIDNLQRQDNFAQWGIDNLYRAARNTEGRAANIDPSAFTNRANDLLDTNLLGGKLPSDVRNLLNRAATGEMPLTVDVAEQFKTQIGALQRASTDPAERLALGHVRSALDDAPLLEGQGQQAIDAFNRARSANRNWMNRVDEVPALAAVRDGVQPDQFVQKFIVGNGGDASLMNVAQLKNMIGNDQQTMQSVRGMIVSDLKQKALNGATDEVGKFSQSSFNKALDAIGDRKLRLFFQPEELNQLRAIGRVASYEQVQPAGSAVNNSNTAGTLFAQVLDKIGSSPLLRKIPLGNQLAEPALNASIGIQAKQAANVPSSLLLPMKKRPMMLGASPAIGLLGPSE